jgi:hypothetical protein
MATFFEQDHDRLDDLLTQFHQLKRSDCARAKACFVEFKVALQRHIVWEEDSVSGMGNEHGNRRRSHTRHAC